ncbi:hypothetical protein GCM10009734_29160 [Nonomuraea bangladeshensis]
MTYLRGLLLDGRRKSMQPMAGCLGVDHQGLQQFVTSSTWDTRAVRARLARRADPEATAAVLISSLTYFPLLRILIGHTPGDLDRETFLTAWAGHAARTLALPDE